MNQPAERGGSDLVRRGYAEEEISSIYELGRLCLENGSLRQAETILLGLTEVAPDYAPAWLGMSYIHIQNRNFDGAIFAARQALRIDPNFTEAMLYLVACLLTTGDFNAAGTYLGEVSDKIEGGLVDDSNVIRFFRAQLARYQSR